MVKNFFKNEDEQTQKDLFNQKWKEYIELAEKGDSDE